jgi:hypothetical protein
MPLIKARSSSIISSVDLRGQPTAVTAAAGTSTTQIASTSFVRQAVADLISSAPSVLDTLNELAAALGNDANFSTTITQALAAKVAIAGGTMTGLLTLSGAPTADLHAATKKYVDDAIDAQMIYSTDDVTEGTTNLYFTATRARSAITLATDNSTVLSFNSATGAFTYAHPNSDGIQQGSTNKYYTAATMRGDISLVSDDNQILSYGSSTGQFTFTTPTTNKITEGSSNLYFTTARARASVSAGSNISYNSSTGVISTQAAVFSVNTQTGVVVLDTDNIDEGADNLYFTNARASQAITLTTDDTTILSYSNGAFTFVKPNTDKIAEGTDNKYFTTARARDSISVTGWSSNISYSSGTGVITVTAPTTTNVTEGTNLYHTTARVRAAVSATDAGGDGSFSYDSATGAFTYTGPSAAEVRAHFGATSNTGVVLDSETGTFSLAEIPNAVLTNNKVTVNGVDISLGGSTTFDADDIAEAVGGTNKYFTEARFDTSFGAKSTTNLTEGTNLYYTQARFDTAFGAKSTTNLTEGTSLYFTTARARDSLVAGTGVTYTASTGTIAIGQDVSTTSDVTFGDVTVSGDLTVNGTMTAVNSTTVTIADKNLTLASGAANATAANGAGLTVEGPAVPATFTYTSANDSWNVNKNVYVPSVVVETTVTATTGFVGNLTGNVTGNLTGNVTGNSSTATALQTARNIQGVAFDGTGNITVVTAGTGVTVTGTSVAIGQAVGTSSSVTFAGVTSPLTGNVTGNVLGNVTGTVSDISNHNTDALTEGLTNLYATPTRIRAALSATSSSGVEFNSATGTFSLSGIPNSSLTNSSITINGASIALGGSDTLDTNDISEGTTNKYFTDARVRSAISLTTSDSGVLSYDSATGAFTFALSGINTDEVTEGTTNQYFTTTRARASISNGSNISYDSTTGVISTLAAVHSVNTQTGAVVLGSDNIAEGTTNKYFTNARAAAAITVVTDDADILSYVTGTGTLTFVTPDTDAIDEGAVNMYYTEARGQAAVEAASVLDLSDVMSTGTLNDGYSLVYNAALQKFVAQNVAVTVTTLNFTGDGTTTSFNTELEINTINDVQVFINGLVQAPTYSYTVSTTSGETSIIFDSAPEANDYIMVRATPTAQLSAGGILNENSTIDGGTY